MAIFYVGNTIDDEGKTSFNGTANFTARFEFKKAGKATTVPITLGVPTNIDVSATKDWDFYLIVECSPPDTFAKGFKGATNQTPITILEGRTKVTTSLSSPDISSGDVGRRTFAFMLNSEVTPEPDPTEDLRDFFVGNDFVSGSGIVAKGNQNFTAILRTVKDGVTLDTNIPMGVKTKVDVLGISSAEWIVTVPSDTELCLVRTIGAPTNIVPVDNKVTYALTKAKWESTNDSDRMIEVKERLRSKVRFNFGNVLNGVTAEQKGESKFNGSFALNLNADFTKPIFYDRAKYEPLTVRHNIIGGFSEEVTMYPYDTGVITITPDGDNVLTGTIFPSDAEIVDNKITYNMLVDQLSPTNLEPRNYVVSVNNESTDPNGDIDPEPADTSSINNNYLVTKSQLKDFEKAVGDIQKTEASYQNIWWVSIVNYVSSIRVLPFKIDESNVEKGSEIKIRSESLSYGKLLKSDGIRVPLGKITIPKVFNSSLDTMSTDVELMIPFSSALVTLDASQVVGCILDISLYINISNGATTVNVYNDTLKRLINTSNINIGSDYPFFSRMTVEQIVVAPTQAENNLARAFIKVNRPDYEFSKPMSVKRGVVADQKGYVEFEDIEINNKSLADEKDLLHDILMKGVYIK